MSHPQSHQVIVGAGLVGLLLVIVLRESGYSVTVYDEDFELKEASISNELHCFDINSTLSVSHKQLWRVFELVP